MAGAAAVLLGCGCALLLRGRRSQRALERCRLARPIVLLLAVPIGFYLLERPWNDQLLAMDPFYAAVNLCVLGALFAIVYAAGQRTRGAVVAFLAACLLAGTANHVILFKGQPIVPADVFALSTAASVGAGYTFALDARLLEAASVFAIASTAIAFLPKVAATPRRAVANGACALALASCFGWWIGTYDIEEAYACTVDVWGVKESYAEQGSALCFLKRVQDLSPARPEGYDADAVSDLLRSLSDDSASMPDGAEAPTVIAIMNETFSDLTRYPGLAGTDASAHYYDIAARRSKRATHTRRRWRGTCNSEFEFPTDRAWGTSAAACTYVLYDRRNGASCRTSSLIRHHAVHPPRVRTGVATACTSSWLDEFADQRAFADAVSCAGSPPTAPPTTTCSTCWKLTKARFVFDGRCRTTAATT
ncbi:MAG: hypothetical protein ACLTMP_12320 [Eggerthella lenta]